MATTTFKSSGAQSKGGSLLVGMVLIGAAYFSLTHLAMVGIHLNNNGTKAQAITEQAAVNKADQENQGGILHHTYQAAKDATVKAVSNPMNGTGEAAIHRVASNVAGTKRDAQTTTYSGTKDDAKRYVRPTCSATEYYAAAPISPEE